MAKDKKPKTKKDGTPDLRSLSPNLFPPGVSGNPNGRPKKGRALSDQLREMMASKEISIEVTIKSVDKKAEKKIWKLKSSHDFNTIVSMALIEKAVRGDVYAIHEIFDRLEGKPVQSNMIVDTTDDEFKNLPLEEKQNKLRELLISVTNR